MCFACAKENSDYKQGHENNGGFFHTLGIIFGKTAINSGFYNKRANIGRIFQVIKKNTNL